MNTLNDATEDARCFVNNWMKEHFKNKTFTKYIETELAGDFAYNLANALRANTPESSAAQGAMGDVLDRFKLAEILEQLDVHRKTGAATLAETLFKAIEKYLVKVAQPSDATAQRLMAVTDEMIDAACDAVQPPLFRADAMLALEAGIAAAQQIVDLTDERAAFEAWWISQPHRCKPEQFNDGMYKYPAAYAAWNVWQARAALANTSQAKTTEPCKTCSGTGIVDDGYMTHSGGIEFENGPIKCVKDCPDCALAAKKG